MTVWLCLDLLAAEEKKRQQKKREKEKTRKKGRKGKGREEKEEKEERRRKKKRRQRRRGRQRRRLSLHCPEIFTTLCTNQIWPSGNWVVNCGGYFKKSISSTAGLERL